MSWSWSFRERLGLTHAPQVIAVPTPDDLTGTRRIIGIDGAIQASISQPGTAFLHLTSGIAPFTELTARLDDAFGDGPVRVLADGAEVVLSNGRCSVRLPLGRLDHHDADGIHPGPVAAMRVGDGPWRGRSFLDTRAPDCRMRGELLEDGPLRAVHRFTADLGGGRSYVCETTLDADADFVRLDETFLAGEDDQVVWDFSGADLPRSLLRLDSGAGHHVIRPEYTWQHQYARIWAWSQYSQLRDDGIGLAMADGDVIGFVALAGGDWRGLERNQLECWTRRWRDDAPRCRRLPPGLTADAIGPDAIPARGRAVHLPHLSVEGWIRGGRRSFALVLAPRSRVDPPGGAAAGEPLGPFEGTPTPERYHAQQGLLRRIHTQSGLMPLQRQIDLVVEWNDVPAAPLWPHAGLADQGQAQAWADAADPLAAIATWLEARVLGFWMGSGSAYCNAVVGRPLAPMLLLVQRLLHERPGIDATGIRARLAFLCHLYADDGYCPIEATMRPLGDPDGSEPLLEGMANQNFQTDVLVAPGTFGCVFPGHPQAAAWRARADRQWTRQMAFHCYPGSGLWEESHTYYCHVLATIYPWLLARRHAGCGDGFADPALHRLVGAALLQLAPRDERLDGARWLVPVGDHDVDPQHYRWLAHRFAEAIAPHNAQLAGHLAWLHHEAGGTRLSDPDPRPFPWRSGGVTGLGHCLRCDSGTHEELLLLRAGGAWAHHHADNGSLWLYSHGRGIITDVAGGGIPASGMAKAAAGSHSRWLPDGGTPIDVLWRHHRGWIQESDDAAAHPWALAWCPVRAIAGEALAREGMRGIQHLTRCIRHQRLSVQLAPGVWLVLDHTPDAAGRARFHCALPMPPRQVYGGVSGEPRPGLGLRLVPLAPTAITIAGREASERQPALGTVAVDIATRPGWSGCIIAVGAATDVAVVSATGRWTAIVNGRRWDIAREDGRWTITGPTGCTTIPIPDCPDHADEG